MGIQEVSTLTLFDIAPVLVCPLPWPIVMKYGGGGGEEEEEEEEKRKKKKERKNITMLRKLDSQALVIKN